LVIGYCMVRHQRGSCSSGTLQCRVLSSSSSTRKSFQWFDVSSRSFIQQLQQRERRAAGSLGTEANTGQTWWTDNLDQQDTSTAIAVGLLTALTEELYAAETSNHGNRYDNLDQQVIVRRRSLALSSTSSSPLSWWLRCSYSAGCRQKSTLFSDRSRSDTINYWLAQSNVKYAVFHSLI